MLLWLWVTAFLAAGTAGPLPEEVESEQTRKLLGSSVVTSVSVIMDHGNGTKTYLTDDQSAKRPQIVGTPGTLLSPNRYEYYSFGEDGELVKKLMTLDQIQSLIAGGDELEPLPIYYPQTLVDSSHTEGVHKVLESVQNVLKGELQAAKIHDKVPMPLPDDAWSILLPGLLNPDYKEPHFPEHNHVTAGPSTTIFSHTTRQPPVQHQKRPPVTSTKYTTTPQRPISSSTYHQHHQSTVASTTQMPETTTTRKTTPPDTKYTTTYYNTPSTVNVKTTKPQKPYTTTKRPYASTKKPYISESPYSKIPLSNLTKTEPIKATTVKRPTTTQERNPSTKLPETRKPLPEKQKPSGIPTITHYLPISSSSPPNSTQKLTTPHFHEATTVQERVVTTTKEPPRVTTTKRPLSPSTPSHSTTTHKLVHTTTTKRPEKLTYTGKPTATTYHKVNNTHKITSKPTYKPQKHTIAAQNLVTKHQTKVTTTTQATTAKVPVTEQTPLVYQLISTTTKESLVPNAQKLVHTKKPEAIKPANLVGQSSNVVNTKLKPTEVTNVATKTTPPPTTERVTQAPSTTLSDRITTFSYTSKGTSAEDIPTSTVPGETSTQHTVSSRNPPSTTQKLISSTSKITERPMEKVTLVQDLHVTAGVVQNVTTTNSVRVTNTPMGGTTAGAETKKPETTEKPLFKETLSQQEVTLKPVATTSVKPQSNIVPTTFKPTEKPLIRVTLPHLESVGTKTPTSTTPSQKPTTYHPQNFNFASRRPVTQSTHLAALFIPSASTTPQPENISTAVPSTTHNYQTSSYTNSTTRIPEKTTTIAATKPTTEPVAESSTVTLTTLGVNAGTSAEVTQTESSAFSTEDMPLQEIPLKIYESLKDPVSGAQDIMSTIMSENIPMTTTSKLDTTFLTTNTDETVGSTTMADDKLTTIQLSSSTAPSSTNKDLTNNVSYAQTTESLTTISDTEPSNYTLIVDSVHGASESIPVEKKVNESMPTETTTLSSTDSLKTTEYIPETTVNMDPTTIYKDQILQEGISAVTSILLDEGQRQQAIKNAMIASVMKNNQNKDDEEGIRTTTENEPTSTTVVDYTEVQTVKQENDKEQMKSEVRLNEDAELPEKPTTEKSKTTVKLATKETVNGNNKQPIKKNEQKAPVLPTKESKLNPESDLVDITKNKKPDLVHAGSDPTVILRTTAAPEVSSTERLKIADFEKFGQKPLGPFAKKPNPVYQPLESLQPPAAIELHPAPYESMGLEASIAFLGEDVRRFADLCNELAFRMWTSTTGKGQISSRSLVMSPFAVTSLLAMVFLGARGPTSGQMNDVLRLDDMVTFNPHQVFQNVTESVINSKNYGVATAAFVRELYSDKTKGKILDFYKERVQQYYQGHVEEVTFSMIGDIIRRRTNLLVKRQTLGKVPEYLRGSSLNMRPPLAAFSANIFQTDCEQGSTDGRDGEMYFVVRPSTRQRRLVPVPAVVWRTGFLAGYEPSLDATSVCLGAESIVSTILILPGQQGQVAPGDGLARLEQRLIETSYRRGGWSRLLRSLMPRSGLELQIPRFSHRSVLNITGGLQRMGLRDLFNNRADLRGLNGLSNELHLSDMLQVNTFSTCGEETIGARHHVETYPASPQRMGRDDPVYQPPKDQEGLFGDVPLSLRPRQARLPDNPRLRFDRPFLYMVRHNPSGMILHMGRFNPRLLP